MQIINFNFQLLSNRFFSLLALCLLGLSFSLTSYAELKLTHLSGQVQIKQVGGNLVSATAQSQAKSGETILTGKDGYVRVSASDGGDIVLRPNSEFVIESYHFEEAKPQEDNFVYRLLKGGLRTVTGLIGKRGNRDAYQGKSITATIGVRGTGFDIRVCQDDCGVLQNGSYFSLRSGSIVVNNERGELAMNAGEFSFSGFNQTPILLPRDPGIGFTPPPNTIPDLRSENSDKGDSLVKETASPVADSSDIKCEIK